jgi:nicotinamidase-related amidase/type 1 glutamine amidotransferase
MVRPFALLLCLLTTVSFLSLAQTPGPSETPSTFTFRLRSKVETERGSGRYHTITKESRWDAAKTAVIVCDMWDKHWCPGATARVQELAPRMNELLIEARKRGALIIHCPSETLSFYQSHPGRALAKTAPRVAPKTPLQGWCKLMPEREGPLPIDDSDGGCAETEKSFKAWTRQHPLLEIHDVDAITDTAEAYYLIRQRGIENVLILGVHTNMCVLGRPFGIRQLVQQGLNVALVRDMTDTMYNPAKRPFVSHPTGTDFVVDHIEKYWCPTITSTQLIGGKEFRFAEDTRPTVLILAAEDEYKTETTLPRFALEQLGKDFRVQVVFADATNRHHLPGLEQLHQADVLVVSVRRRPLQTAQLALLQEWVNAGKPVVAIRTASHAFAKKGNESLPAGVSVWEQFDREVLGCHYQGHHGAQLLPTITHNPSAADHPILFGIKQDAFRSGGSLYRSAPLHSTASILMYGRLEGKPQEPVAWTFTQTGGGKTFYTSLGHPDDFQQPAFVRLLRNAVYWSAGKAIPK